LVDAVNDGDLNGASIGRKIILPSSVHGSPRYLQQRYQDSMAIAAKYGKASLFITMTTNPKWPEITSELLEGQQANDRPDLIARVFKSKLDSLINDLLKKKIFGRAVAHIYVIEWQKRGLPHAHILLWLAAEDAPRSPDDYDRFVSAEIPDPEAFPELFAAVTMHNLHGPCGAHVPQQRRPPCCDIDGKCKKGFPKAFEERTIDNPDGYPLYRRRNNGRHVTKNGFELDNRWVVPYNPWLILKYNCHICVEICSSVVSIKYIHKYCYKGPDRATLAVQDEDAVDDEIARYNSLLFRNFSILLFILRELRFLYSSFLFDRVETLLIVWCVDMSMAVIIHRLKRCGAYLASRRVAPVLASTACPCICRDKNLSISKKRKTCAI
jgi:hypothetical protein